MGVSVEGYATAGLRSGNRHALQSTGCCLGIGAVCEVSEESQTHRDSNSGENGTGTLNKNQPVCCSLVSSQLCMFR